MRRDVDINDISDGKRYTSSDMVKADCGGCKNCFSCCTGMGDSVVLDPLDIYNLTINLHKSFEELLAGGVALSVYDGVILPHINMNDKEEYCFFLDHEGRCSIHAFRPGICRLFPLGRIYEEDGFSYFLQVNECANKNRSKVKVKKWIDIPDIAKNESYVLEWHNFILALQEHLREQEEQYIKRIDMFVLQHFFVEKYSEDDFYNQFAGRLKKAKDVLKL